MPVSEKVQYRAIRPDIWRDFLDCSPGLLIEVGSRLGIAPEDLKKALDVRNRGLLAVAPTKYLSEIVHLEGGQRPTTYADVLVDKEELIEGVERSVDFQVGLRNLTKARNSRPIEEEQKPNVVKRQDPLDALDIQEREVWTQRKLGRTFKAIASSLGLPEYAVTNRYRRAERKMRGVKKLFQDL